MYGNTKTGGQGAIDNRKLPGCVSDFRESAKCADHKFWLDILNDQGMVLSRPVF